VASVNQSEKIDLKDLRRVCSSCSLTELCLPMGLEKSDVEKLSLLVEQSAPLRTGDHLFRINDPFHVLHAVRSGCFKTYLLDEKGREQVLGFHLPGELVGLDAIYPSIHQCNAVALDTSTVCNLVYNELTELATKIPGLQKQLLRLLSKDISSFSTLAGDHTAEERMAEFLMALSFRMKIRGYSARRLNLVMPRRDIANYLRLATETVSRVLRRFQDEKLIQVHRREIEILDPEGLDQLAKSRTRCNS